MIRPLVVLAACALSLVLGCSNAPACSVHCAGGSPCTGPIECASGVCLGGTCTTACDSGAHACVAGTYCLLVSHGVDGQGMECADHCGPHVPDPVVTGDAACVGGVPVSCATAPTTACAQCLYVVNSHTFHCPDGTYCGATTGADADCVPQHPQGDPCEANDECMSGNCSGASGAPAGAPPSVCEAAAGATCSGTSDCAFCERGVCIQSCQPHAADCPISAPYCLGDATTNQFACRVACDETPSCPTGYTCTMLDTGGRTVHACLPM
jgi:hypothetical protein